ncbi:MAG: Sir2 family NAD-dependent protein deacetylase [Bacteroidia bacterium]|nr:Sir2 family NAD-dependent protein deacetylase [Bacteroidia bacterium]
MQTARSAPHIVVLTGAGISAESGIQTFRGAGGLWEGRDVLEVASIDGFHRNPELVLRFYNERRAQLRHVAPNAGHLALVELEQAYRVDIVTQNVDDLHERAGSSHVLHLHGLLTEGRSVRNPEVVVPVAGDIQLGDLAPDGHQLRPNIVWFGEEVPMIIPAARLFMEADILIIVGTSLVVYPAAGLIGYARPEVPVYVVDPHRPSLDSGHLAEYIQEPATIGLPALTRRLLTPAASGL